MIFTMFTGFGTVLNVSTILLGSAIGIVVGEKLRERSRSLITDILGLVTILGAASAIAPIFKDEYLQQMPVGWASMPILISLLAGGLIGSALRLEERFESLGRFLKQKFRSNQSSFVEGFLDASLLFVIGPLAILGSISDGLGTGVDQLVLKSTLDGFASIAFASSLGWGVAASAIPVAIYQGSWTLVGLALGSVLATYQMHAMTITGGLMLLAIGLRLLKIKQLPVGNLLPALFLAPLFAGLFNSFI
jgi:uncharacterized membrane protein YqgA involved in biofilm formation